MQAESRFPAGFLWGTATAAYQIEGAARDDGRGRSIWDAYSHTPGMTANGDTGDVACDHYHRWRDDIALMRELGLGAYRFSISWPRVLPEGTGSVEQRGVDFYSRLVDTLLEAGIVPAVTLYHWDLPDALQRRGGWAARETVDAFVVFADIMARALGDRVSLWMTHNEPSLHANFAHGLARGAPGIADLRTSMRVAHHLLLSHGKAVPAVRAASDGKIGIALLLSPVEPASETAGDAEAAQRVDEHYHRWYLEALYRGRYPDHLWQLLASRGAAPDVQADDLRTIAAPIDFLGVNYYHRWVVAAAAGQDDAAGLGYRMLEPVGELTDMPWEVHPAGLHGVLTDVARGFDVRELYVTESGASYEDVVAADGGVHDEKRIRYLERHFAQALRAIGDGAPLRGFFVWSLLDTFEWTHGYGKRFGVVHVDHATQRRRVKDSGRYLASIAQGDLARVQRRSR